MNNPLIYKMTFPNGKIYVGQTINWTKRLRQHLSSSKKGAYPVSNAIRKYGWENVKTEFVFCPEDKLNDLEIEMIRDLNTMVPNGYNLSPGGVSTAGYKWSEEQKKKLYGKSKNNTHACKDYIITLPDGSIIEINNLSKFCHENGLTQSAMYRVCIGRRKQHKGYKIRYKD